MDVESNSEKILKETVKTCKQDTKNSVIYKENLILKKLIFVENGWGYSITAKKLNDLGHSCTRQYIYGIVTGRMKPSFNFAKALCNLLGIQNVYTIFDISDLHLPNFQTAKTLEERDGN